MTNYKAIQYMSPEQMEDILDQIYLAGLNNGMYAAHQDDDSILDTNPFNLRWLNKSAEKRQIQVDAISGCLFALGELDILQIQFSDALWNATVERVTVYADGRLVFRFRNGVEVTVK